MSVTVKYPYSSVYVVYVFFRYLCKCMCVFSSRPLTWTWALTGKSVINWSVTEISSGSALMAASSQLCLWTVRKGLSMIWSCRLRMGPRTLVGPPSHSPSKCWTWMDNSPAFFQPAYHVTLPENSPLGMIILQYQCKLHTCAHIPHAYSTHQTQPDQKPDSMKLASGKKICIF